MKASVFGKGAGGLAAGVGIWGGEAEAVLVDFEVAADGAVVVGQVVEVGGLGGVALQAILQGWCRGCRSQGWESLNWGKQCTAVLGDSIFEISCVLANVKIYSNPSKIVNDNFLFRGQTTTEAIE